MHLKREGHKSSLWDFLISTTRGPRNLTNNSITFLNAINTTCVIHYSRCSKVLICRFKVIFILKYDKNTGGGQK